MSLICGYKIPDVLLENIQLELNALGLFIDKQRDGKRSVLILHVEDLNDIYTLNLNHFINIWQAALSNYYDVSNSAYSNCVQKGINNILNAIVEFISEFVFLNNSLSNNLLETDSCEAIVSVNGEARLSKPIAVLQRGACVMDVISKEELSNYSYKRNIRDTSLDLPRRTSALLLGLKPKRKTKAKTELLLCSAEKLVYLVPNHSDISFALTPS